MRGKRGNLYCFFASTDAIVEETKIMWRYTGITPEDLESGDHISITFTGEVLESYPAQIQQVDIIQLLEDKR